MYQIPETEEGIPTSEYEFEKGITRLFPGVSLKENHHGRIEKIVKNPFVPYSFATIAGIQVNFYHCRNKGRLVLYSQFNEYPGFGGDLYKSENNTVNYTRKKQIQWKKDNENAKARDPYGACCYIKVPLGLGAQMLFAAGSGDGFIDVLAIESGKRFMSICIKGQEEILSMSSPQDYLLVVTTPGFVRIFNILNGSLIHCVKCTKAISSLLLDNTLVVALSSGTMRSVELNNVKGVGTNHYSLTLENNLPGGSGQKKHGVLLYEKVYDDLFVVLGDAGVLNMWSFSYDGDNFKKMPEMILSRNPISGAYVHVEDDSTFYVVICGVAEISFFRITRSRVGMKKKLVHTLTYEHKKGIEYTDVFVHEGGSWLVVSSDRGYLVKFEIVTEEEENMWNRVKKLMDRKRKIIQEYSKKQFQLEKRYIEMAIEQGAKIHKDFGRVHKSVPQKHQFS